MHKPYRFDPTLCSQTKQQPCSIQNFVRCSTWWGLVICTESLLCLTLIGAPNTNPANTNPQNFAWCSSGAARNSTRCPPEVARHNPCSMLAWCYSMPQRCYLMQPYLIPLLARCCSPWPCSKLTRCYSTPQRCCLMRPYSIPLIVLCCSLRHCLLRPCSRPHCNPAPS